MAKFQIQAKKENDRVTVTLAGPFDESASFANVDLAGVKTLDLDFKDVDAITSYGIREWLNWYSQMSPELTINYFNCTKPIVDQINTVSGLIKKGIVLQSFFTPYYCEACKIFTSLLLTKGKEFTDSTVAVPESIPCTKCKGTTELGIIENKYFNFIKKISKA